MYPQNKDESDKFAAGIIKLIHNEKTQQSIVKELQDDRAPVALRLGSVASKVIMRMVMLVQEQAGGRKPHFQMLIAAIKMTVKELAEVCKVIGVQVAPKDLAEASRIAGDLIEGGFKGQEQGQPTQQGAPQVQPQQQLMPQQPQRPQGLIGGAI